MRKINFYTEAKKYLISKGATEEMLAKQINEWRTRSPKNMSELFQKFLMHAQNRQGMPNSIGDIQRLSDVLHNFDSLTVRRNYNGWRNLFDAVQEGDYNPPGRLDPENPRSHWVIYCKSIISISEFLSQYESITDFQDFVRGFLTNEHSKLALPLLLKEEIFGFGFALACDFLKENVSPEFLKPDTHINDIARGLGISNSYNDYRIFKDMISYCREINELPYDVDKVFWLVGSGNFYLSGVRIDTSKSEFIEICLSKIRRP